MIALTTEEDLLFSLSDMPNAMCSVRCVDIFCWLLGTDRCHVICAVKPLESASGNYTALAYMGHT